MSERPWDRIHDALYIDCRDLEGREPQPSAAIIDSQSVKTGTNARGDVGYDAGKKVKGASAIYWSIRRDYCYAATCIRRAYGTVTVPAACSTD